MRDEPLSLKRGSCDGDAPILGALIMFGVKIEMFAAVLAPEPYCEIRVCFPWVIQV